MQIQDFKPKTKGNEWYDNFKILVKYKKAKGTFWTPLAVALRDEETIVRDFFLAKGL